MPEMPRVKIRPSRTRGVDFGPLPWLEAAGFMV
jgi:hypothetical protein